MSRDDIIELCFACPFMIVVGLGLGLMVCMGMGIDFSGLFSRDCDCTRCEDEDA